MDPILTINMVGTQTVIAIVGFGVGPLLELAVEVAACVYLTMFQIRNWRHGFVIMILSVVAVVVRFIHNTISRKIP